MDKLVVANRGEIAVRIMRAARERGLATVAVYSDADADAEHVRFADEAVHVGAAQAARSYLDADAIIRAAHSVGADALHPGYGFLAEDADFARACSAAGLIFVGPDPETIDTMGNKSTARTFALEAGVPVVSGSGPLDGDLEESIRAAEELGFPVLIKAAAGGGGRGIRLVMDAADLQAQLAVAAREAEAAFADGTLYLERYIRNARHIEVQILGDGTRVIHLFERDCSVQRRRQKMVEESPAPGLSGAMRTQLTDAGVLLAEAARYRSAGTVEFLVDVDADKFYFIEMNTRIQVEHPVTEVVTGVDLIQEQLAIAAGDSIGLEQHAIQPRGHAIELRLNAEDPALGFMPSPGVIERVHWPAGPWVRVDTAFKSGSDVPPYYDSLLAKIIVWGRTREAALSRAEQALAELEVQGIATTKSALARILASDDFRNGTHNTAWWEAQSELAGD